MAQAPALQETTTTQHWQLALDEGTGALARLAHPADAYGMNWVCAQAENGNPGRCWDPLANDQDWAMVFLLQAAAIDPDFVRERWT